MGDTEKEEKLERKEMEVDDGERGREKDELFSYLRNKIQLQAKEFFEDE